MQLSLHEHRPSEALRQLCSLQLPRLQPCLPQLPDLQLLSPPVLTLLQLDPPPVAQTPEGWSPHDTSLPAAGLLQGPSLLRLLGQLALCCWQTAWALDARWGQAAVPEVWQPAWRWHSSGALQMQPWCYRQQCGRWRSCPLTCARKQGWPGLLLLQGAFVHPGAAADKQVSELLGFMPCHIDTGFNLVRCVQADVASAQQRLGVPDKIQLCSPQQGLLLTSAMMKHGTASQAGLQMHLGQCSSSALLSTWHGCQAGRLLYLVAQS